MAQQELVILETHFRDQYGKLLWVETGKVEVLPEVGAEIIKVESHEGMKDKKWRHHILRFANVNAALHVNLSDKVQIDD